jgi:acyl carrier protein
VSLATVVETAVRRHVEARVAAIAGELGADPRRIAPEIGLDDLGLDSLDLAELVQILELEFDLKLFALAHGRIHTVGDAIELVVSQLSEAN